MNGTRNNYVSSMCGIILSSGRDCNQAVNPDAPLNLCDPHFQAAAEWFIRNDETTRERTLCELCGAREGRAGISGYSCARCEYQSPDFVGTMRLSAAEKDQSYSRPPEPKKVNVVYYIQFGDRIKIGTSGDPRSRLAALPHDRVLAFERGGVSLESRRHTEFRAHRIGTTEWFRSNPALLSHVALLNSGATDPWALYREWRTA